MNAPTASPACRVFVADDHALVRDGLVALLHREPGFEVCGTAADGETALGLIRQHSPAVALLDHGMPRLGGIALVQRLRAEGNAARLLLLSSFSSPLLIADALNTGADGFLLKDDAFADLRDALRTAMRGELALSRSVDRDALRDALNSVPPTLRERAVLAGLVAGRSLPQIGALLGISPRTAETYRNRLAAKFGARNVVDLVRRAVAAGYAGETDPTINPAP